MSRDVPSWHRPPAIAPDDPDPIPASTEELIAWLERHTPAPSLSLKALGDPLDAALALGMRQRVESLREMWKLQQEQIDDQP